MWGRRQFRPAVRRSRLIARRSSWTGLGAVVGLLACLAVVALTLVSKSRAAPAAACVSADLPARLPQRGQAQAGWCPGATPTPRPGTQPRTFLPLVLGGGGEKPACTPECAEPNDDPFHTCPVVEPGPHCGTMVAGRPDDLADWYRLDAGCAFTLTVQLDGPDGADFDLYVYGDPPGDPLAWGNSAGPDESLSLRIGPGTVYVVPTRVQGDGAYELRLGRQ